MKKLIVGVLCLPIFFVLNTLYAHSVLADACIGATCYSTIQEAVDAATAGDVINVQNGIYTEPVTISKQVTLVGENKDLTVIQTGTTNIGFSLLAGADNVVVSNLKFTGNGEGINANDVSNLTLQDLVISDNSLTTSGIYLFNVNTVNITGSTFSNNIIDIDIVDSTSNVSISSTTFNGGSSTTYYISNDTSNDVTATDNNSWDTLDANTINTYLYDKNDEDSLGRVIFDDTVPTVDAGTDKTVNASFTQDATGTDTYGIASYLWEQISGPGFVSFDDPAIEDPLITADTEGTYELQLTITDTSGNSDTDIFQLIWDITPPQLTSAQTQDLDRNGQIDAMVLTFDENIDDSQLELDTDDGWDVAGYTGETIGTGTTDNDNILLLSFDESGTPDTAATPDVTYTSPATSTHDLAGNELQSVTQTSLDLAEPAVLSAKTQDTDANGQLDAIKITFSEPINTSLLINEADHWTVSDGYTVSSVDGELVLHLDEKISNDTGALPTISYSRTGGETSVHDLSPDSNELVDGTWSTTDLATPKVAWANPAFNTTISGTGVLEVSATDEDVTKIKSVEYLYKFEGTPDTFHSLVVDTTAPYSYPWDTTSLQLGKYTVKAVVTDNADNVSEINNTLYVAAVITSFTHFTVDTNRIQIDWTTDRPTDGRVVYDTHSHSGIDVNDFPNYGYALSTGTLDYGTTHSMIIAGLSDNTYYYFRAVSAGTPIVISNQGWNKTFTVAGGGGGGGGGGGSTPTSNTPPATPPAPAAIQGQVAGVATEEPVVEELLPTPTPNPTPVVEGTATELPSFNWWLVIIPLPFVLGFLLWLARRLRS